MAKNAVRAPHWPANCCENLYQGEKTTVRRSTLHVLLVDKGPGVSAYLEGSQVADDWEVGEGLSGSKVSLQLLQLRLHHSLERLQLFGSR